MDENKLNFDDMELSDEQLDQVAGGKKAPQTTSKSKTKSKSGARARHKKAAARETASIAPQIAKKKGK